MSNRIFILFFLISLVTNKIFAQEPAAPLDIPLILSANFGELRNNHFHSGIDFKTQGQVGLPIKAIEEGYVSKINVSPTGYGRVLYIDHPNGTTTVYAHLDRFAGRIEDFVCDSQYIKESFKIEMQLPKEKFPIKKGEVIGYGGNTGSSGGPHLHFEIRNTQSEEPMDPLPIFMTKIKDNREPEIQSLMIYPQAGKGIVNGKTSKQLVNISKNKTGKKTITTSIQAWGEVGLALKAYDYMDGTSNVYGVNYISLAVDDVEIFSFEMHRFSFSETRYLNSFVDWEEWVYRKAFFMKSFVDPGNSLRMLQAKNHGIIHINEEKKYKITYVLKDLYGNTTDFEFYIEGKKQEIPAHKPYGTYYAYNKDNHIIVDEVDLTIPRGNLYTDIYFTYSKKKRYNPYSSLYTLSKRAPLHSYCPLIIRIENDSFPDKDKYGVIFVEEGRTSWVGGVYENGKLVSEIRELGNYSITIDTIAPVITELNPTTWTRSKKIIFKVRDNLSGISNWKATLNGDFALFEFDAKTATLFCTHDMKKMKKGKQNLILWVEDNCGNRKTFKKEIVW